MKLMVGYDMCMEVSGNNTETIDEIIRERKYQIIEVLSPKIREVNNQYYLAVKDEKTNQNISKFGTYLNIFPARNSSYDSKYVNSHRFWIDKEGDNDRYKVTNLTREELREYLQGRKLLFHVTYMEHFGNVESVINSKFLDHIMLLRRKDDFSIYGDYYDIRIYLQKTEHKGKAIRSMNPVDPRDFDINDRMLYCLKKLSTEYFSDGTDFCADYCSVSDKLTAQYFVTRFHSNKAWDKNPVVHFNFRISAFLIPGIISSKEAHRLSKNRLTAGTNGKIYKIDSIHFNSDIFSNMREFEEMLEFHFYEVTLA